MKPGNPNGGLVYSTEAGRMCPACRQPVAQCACKQAVAPPTDGVVRLFFETKGRGGKGVTVVRGLGLAEPELIREMEGGRLLTLEVVDSNILTVASSMPLDNFATVRNGAPAQIFQQSLDNE